MTTDCHPRRTLREHSLEEPSEGSFVLVVVQNNQGGLLYDSRRLELDVSLTDICKAHSLMEFKVPCGFLACSLDCIAVEAPSLH